MVFRVLPVAPGILAVALVFFADGAGAQAFRGPVVSAPDTEYRLGPGDILKITIFKHEDISASYRVEGNGDVSFPMVGSIKASGRTVPQFQESLVKKLKEGYLKNPSVSIEVTNYRPFFILGEVKAPGNYPYQSRITVINAVALAGGFTNRAAKEEITITRIIDGKETKIKAAHNQVVLPGDTIEIAQRLF
jgi:polysaccharide export outer membrane protein